MKKISAKQKIILIIFGLFLSIVLLEIGLRIGGLIYLSLQEYRNIRSIKQKGDYIILCLGDSMVARTWTEPLEEILNQRDIGIKFSVIDKGVPGSSTGDILSRLRHNIDKYQPNMVITMVGINDAEGSTLPYEDIPTQKITLSPKSFRTYKLARLLNLHIANKARATGKENELKKAIKVNPRNDEAWAYAELGRYYRFQGEHDKAKESFKKALSIDPKNSSLYVELGVYYRDGEIKFDKAKEMFRRAIKIDPKNDNAYWQLGCAYRFQGDKEKGKYDYEKVEEFFKKAIGLNSKNVSAYTGLGWCYSDQGKYDKAEEIFKKAITANPESGMVYGSLATFYTEQGKYELADKYFRKTNIRRLEDYNPTTRHNYEKLKEIVTQREIRLVCAQYPMRSVESLKKMFEEKDDIIFVDNEMVFKKALKQGKYKEYFVDMFGGDFGHCTPKGYRLLAQNIADVILKKCFE